jgi:hypothetical protein
VDININDKKSANSVSHYILEAVAEFLGSLENDLK